MPYATQADIVAVYGEQELLLLADRNRDGAADPDVVDVALADAAEEIDGYLSAQYDLPLDEAGSRPLRRIAVDIACYRLPPTDALVTDERRARYRDAVRYLERVSEGKIRLGVGDDESAHPTRIRMTSRERRVSGRMW